jgi:hypothetical protein
LACRHPVPDFILFKMRYFRIEVEILAWSAALTSYRATSKMDPLLAEQAAPHDRPAVLVGGASRHRFGSFRSNSEVQPVDDRDILSVRELSNIDPRPQSSSSMTRSFSTRRRKSSSAENSAER